MGSHYNRPPFLAALVLAPAIRSEGLFVVMSIFMSWRFLIFVGCMWFALGIASSRGNEPAAGGAVRDGAKSLHGPARSSAAFLGNQYCVSCHSGGTKVLEAIAEQAGHDLSGFVALNEAPAYLSHDRHARSKELVASALGKEIGFRLGIEDVTQSDRCMNCHGAPAPPGHALGKYTSISCESCHGAAGPADSPAPYLLAHQQAALWRPMSPEKKHDQGMLDVRLPTSQAGLCLACHVGSPAEGRWVDHDMYAAGHPLLAEVELGTLMDALPRHWIPAERKGAGRGPFRHSDQWYRSNGMSTTTPTQTDFLARRVKRSLIGAVIAEERVVSVAESFARNQRWPELSFLRCEACHHDLKRPSSRPPLARRGLPAPRYANQLLVDLAATAASAEHVANSAMADWKQLFFDATFGDVQAIIGSAPAASERMRELAASVAGTRLTAPQVNAIRTRLLDGIDATVDDWESMRRTLWLWRQCADEDFTAATNDDSPVRQAWATMDEHLLLSLPPGNGSLGASWISAVLSRGASLDRESLAHAMATLRSAAEEP